MINPKVNSIEHSILIEKNKSRIDLLSYFKGKLNVQNFSILKEASYKKIQLEIFNPNRCFLILFRNDNISVLKKRFCRK